LVIYVLGVLEKGGCWTKNGQCKLGLLQRKSV